MDFLNEILALLRGSDADKPEVTTGRAEEAAAAAELLGDRAYFDYKREARASGDPILSPAEFRRAQAEGRF